MFILAAISLHTIGPTWLSDSNGFIEAEITAQGVKSRLA
jgi:hypothetical protein